VRLDDLGADAALADQQPLVDQLSFSNREPAGRLPPEMAPSIAWASWKYSGVGLDRSMSNVNAAATDVLLGAGATPAWAQGLHALCSDDRTWVNVRASPRGRNPTSVRLHAFMS
jgi:hypothetical protein